MQKVINFSGGQSSAYMTILSYVVGDIVLFCDTGREHPETYEFIRKFEEHENIPITKIQYPGGFSGMLEKRDYKRIPNRMLRICTEELKVNTAKRYLKSIGILRFDNYIGFRFDEDRRVKKHKEKFKKVSTHFPLFELKVTKEIVHNFWKNKNYKLEIPSILGNCDLCFMKGKDSILAILSKYPELADKWIIDEEKAKKHFGHTYFPGVTIKQLRESAQKLQKPYDLEKAIPAQNCACTF